MSNIFFTSDTHFGHNSILKYSERPFSTILEHDNSLIENWNKEITKKDTVYHLGDFALCAYEYYKSILRRLNGNIVLIEGNHDKRNLTNDRRKLFTSTCDVKLLKIDGRKLWLSHYPHISYPFCVLHLFGHTHSKQKRPYENIEMINVGVDAWDYNPVHYDTIKSYFNPRTEGVGL